VSGVIFKYKGKMPDRPVDGNAVEAKAYLSSGASQNHSDISLVLEQLGAVTPEAAARFGAPRRTRSQSPPHCPALEPRQVRIGSANWHDPAIIDATIGDRSDLRAIIGAIQRGARTGSPAGINDVRDVEVIPGPRARHRRRRSSTNGLRQFSDMLRNLQDGIDNLAFVDPELRVHGLQNLRVADASVMPASSPGRPMPDADDRRKGGAADPGRTLKGTSPWPAPSMSINTFLPDFLLARTNEGENPVGGSRLRRGRSRNSPRVMDDAGIDVAMLSISTPGVHVGDDTRARALARGVTNSPHSSPVQAGIVWQLRRPFRYPDVDGALEELRYALDVSKLDRRTAVLERPGDLPWRPTVEPVSQNSIDEGRPCSCTPTLRPIPWRTGSGCRTR